MAVDVKNLCLLLSLAERRYIKRNGRIVEIGAQQLANSVLRSKELVRRAEAAFGAGHRFSLPASRSAAFSSARIEMLDNDAPAARDFWISLGFEYASIDLDRNPDSVPLDLNYDQVPDVLKSRYDLVTNFGTTEHICNQMNAFKAIHDLAALGGVIVHHLPADGHFDHGLVKYNLKFFWSLARCNEYKWLHTEFYGGEQPYDIPQNVLDALEPEVVASLQGCKVANYDLLIAFQKTLDAPFVPALEADAAGRVGDDAMKRRYWTLFQPKIVDTVRQGGALPGWISKADDADDGNPAAQLPAFRPNFLRAIGRGLAGIEARIRQAAPSRRRLVASVAAASAACTAIVMGLVFFATRLLFS